MRSRAVEIIGIALAENRGFFSDSNLEASAENDAAFLAVMGQRMFSSAGTGLVALREQLDGPVGEVRANLAVGNTALGNFDEFVGPEEDTVLRLAVVREELSQTHRYAVEDFLQHADGRIELAGFDLGDRRVGDTRLARQLALRELEAVANAAQAATDVLVHEKCSGMFTLMNILRPASFQIKYLHCYT